MNILFITTTFPSESAPMRGLFNFKSVSNLARSNTVRVIRLQALKPGRKIYHTWNLDGIEVVDVSVLRFPMDSPKINLATAKVASLTISKIIQGREELILSSGIHFAGLIGALLAKRHCIKHVVQVIGSDINLRFKKIINRRSYKAYNEGVNGVIAVSDDLKSRAVKVLPDIGYHATVYRGVDLKLFSFHQWESHNGGLRFLFLGGFPGGWTRESGANIKGGLDLLECWKRYETEFEDLGFELTIGGVNSDTNQVKSWRSKLEYPERVKILGLIDQEKVRTSFIEHDVILLPSRYEGLPNLAVESAALGRALIASDVNGIPEIVRNDENGLLVTPGDLDEIAGKMTYLGNNPEKLHNYSLNGRVIAEKHFNSMDFTQKLIDFLGVISA